MKDEKDVVPVEKVGTEECQIKGGSELHASRRAGCLRDP